MVSGYPKSIGIPRVDRLSTGPPGFGVSQFSSLNFDSNISYGILLLWLEIVHGCL